MLRHIAWFNEASVEPRPEGGLTSDDPVVCRRCLAPARAIENLGVECSVFGNLQDADPAEVSRHLQRLHTDIVVIGKFAESSWLPLARAAKHLGCYVVADLDADDVKSPDLVKLAEIVDRLTTTSEETAAAIYAATGHPALVIPECDEQSNGPHSPLAVARLWVDEFRKLKKKPPACANTNEPILH